MEGNVSMNIQQESPYPGFFLHKGIFASLPVEPGKENPQNQNDKVKTVFNNNLSTNLEQADN